LVAALALGCGSTDRCLAGGGPENVFLVVNPASADSLTVANHYIELRKIPPHNVFYLPWKRSKTSTWGGTFRDEILQPILEEMNRRQLGGQVDYVIYSSDFPWRIAFEKEFPTEQFPPQFKPTASLTGATYLWSFVMGKRKEMFNLTTNFYYSPPRGGVTLTRAFHAHQFWDPEGRLSTADKGIPYLLCTMLGVTDGRGNSVDEIARYLDSASKADGTNLKGTIYYVQNNSPRSRPRHDFYPQAVAALALAGVHGEIVRGEFIQNKSQVMGVTCGAAQIDVARSGCRFLPGALCDNLTSAGGNFVVRTGVGPQQTALTDFLRFGAAGACGTVVEPFSIAQKFPSAFLHVHYARGCSMAESFYQAIAGPYQQLIVGDPLCQPWAERPRVHVAGIDDQLRLSGTITLTPSAKTAEGQAVAHFDLFVDGKREQRCAPGGKFALDTTKLADGVHELRVVATDTSAIETQGRWIQDVMVKNGLDAVQISVNEATITEGMKSLSVRVVSTLKEPVAILHNGRDMGTVALGAGTVQIPVESLGHGPITLHAQSTGTSGLRARPLRVVVP
jgi:uncharacterized protein (TIGR03790 family)